MKRVLIVEDNRINQIVASRMLIGLGVECDLADDGLKGLERIQTTKYDLVFMDCQMPVMDGYTAVGEIRKLEQEGKISKLPVVALTAHIMPGDKQKCLDAGMDDYLSKPVTEEGFLDMLRKWLGEYSNTSPSNTRKKYPFKCVNPDDLEKLYDLMGDGFFGLLDVYFSSVGELMDELKGAIEVEDYKTILRTAHTIKSPSRQIGSVEVAAKAAEIEELAKEKSGLREIATKFSIMREQMIAAEVELKKYAESKQS